MTTTNDLRSQAITSLARSLYNQRVNGEVNVFAQLVAREHVADYVAALDVRHADNVIKVWDDLFDHANMVAEINALTDLVR